MVLVNPTNVLSAPSALHDGSTKRPLGFEGVMFSLSA